MSRGGTITLPPQESASKPQHRELTSLPNGVQLDTVPAPSDAKSSTSSPSLSDSLRSLRDPTPSPTCFTTAVVKDHRCSASFSPTTVAAPDRIASHTPLIADNNNNNNNKSGTPADVNDWFRPRDSSANFTLDTRSKTPFSIPALQATQSTGSLQRRPRDRLNAILAGERGTSYLISDAPPIQASRDCASAHSGLTATTRVRSPPVLRSVTAPVLPTVSYSSPHSPPLNMAPPAGNATRTAIMDRNSSMDSAISSLSSTSVSQPSTTSTTHSHRGSSETINAVDPDPATLVTRAGSAEKAIQKLLEERRAQSRKQDKAWEIIEKMKAMVVGLNKDLEKVSKEKERYRKRLKEFQTAAASTSPPPVPSNNADMKSLDRHIDRTNHDRTVETKVMVENTNGKSQQILPRSPTATSRGTRLLKGQGALPSEVDETSPLEKTPTNPQKPFPSPQAANSLSQDHETHSPITPKAHQSKPSWSSPGEKSRKPAPAPLDLSQKSPSKLARGDTEEGESALDLDSEVDEDGIPKFERGRRRTRAEDDRQRELVAMVEDHRSKSNKSNKSKSMSKSKSKGMSKLVDEQADPKAGEPPTASSGDSELPAGMIAGVGLPSSPRANLLGALQSPLQDSMGSIASAIAPAKSTGVGKPTEPQTATFPPKSPGLPMSPRPGDRPPNSAVPRMPASGFTTPGPGPASPRSGLPLSPRAPKHPIPLPRSATVAAFPPTAPSESSKNDHSLQPMSMAERLKLGFPNATSNKPAPIQVHAPPTPTVYKGFMTEQYAGLLLPPNALPLIDVRVFSSRLTPSRSSFQSMISGEDDPHFTLAVHARSDNKQLWRVEKSLQVLFKLDQQVRKAINFRGALPDRNLFSGHAPAKVDARRAALHRYFEEVLDTPMDERAALVVCDFFSQHVIDPGDSSSPTPNDTDSGVSVPGSPTKQERPKEGWLSKKGKQFGGWKERYFILKNSELRHFESPTGPALGIIKLQHAQVGRPSPRSQEEDAEFRHAFTISEPKRRDSSSMMRHVLCAESDEERDSWVEALLAHIDHSDPKTSPAQPSMSFRSPSFSLKGSDANKIRKKNPEMVENTAPVTKQFQSLSYDQTVAAQAPTVGTPKRLPSEFPLEEQAVDDTVPSSHPVISGPVAGGPIQNLASWGNKDARKRSVFGLLNRSLDDSAIGGSKFGRGISPRPPQPERHSPMRQVFGVPLLEATATCRPEGVDVCLPAIVYRCIEYLEAKEAVLEEGIFRVPGSNTVINRLKDRFNTEGDVKLLDGAHIDIHAVASLLKAYLRELPESILTKEHHHDFSKVIELENNHQKIAVINMLLHKLPEQNWELLASLSRYLMMVVDNQDVNKMTLRNVCIVIAPTLNIPNPLISLFITEHDAIFKPEPFDPKAASLVLESLSKSSGSPPPPPSPEDIRSPRKSAFTDVTTPSYQQTTFGHLNAAFNNPQSMSQPQTIEQRLRTAAFNNSGSSNTGFIHASSSIPVTHPAPSKKPSSDRVESAPANRTRHIVGQHARERESPSPASRALLQQQQRLVPSVSAPSMHISQQQVAAAPSQEGYGSLNAAMQGSNPVMASKGRENPSVGEGSGILRRARRESFMMGPHDGGSADQQQQQHQVKHKGSSTRLREAMSNAGAGGASMK